MGEKMNKRNKNRDYTVTLKARPVEFLNSVSKASVQQWKIVLFDCFLKKDLPEEYFEKEPYIYMDVIDLKTDNLQRFKHVLFFNNERLDIGDNRTLSELYILEEIANLSIEKLKIIDNKEVFFTYLEEGSQ